MVLLHTLPQVLDKCCNSTLVTESSRVILQFRVHLTLIWFWGYLKSKVCKSNLRNVSEMEDVIKRKVLQIFPAMMRSLLLSTTSCMIFVIVCADRHVENL